jgi:hypothetical protein
MLQLFRALNSERALNAERPRRARHNALSVEAFQVQRIHLTASCGGFGGLFLKGAGIHIPQVGYDIQNIHGSSSGVRCVGSVSCTEYILCILFSGSRCLFDCAL